MTDLFEKETWGDHLTDKETHLSVIPISVIDIGAQGKRQNEDHDSTSSRANYSPFPVEAATLCAEFYLRDANSVFDPFAGWGERGAAIAAVGKDYCGYDTSPEAIRKAREDYGIENELKDSGNDDIPLFDGLVTCPPYWNLETYASPIGIDRSKSWEHFLVRYRIILSRCWKRAATGTNFCIVVGDWRKGGIYYDLEWETCEHFKQLQATIVDKVVLSRSKVSKIKIMLPQAKRLGYSVRVHEHLLVFQKP